MPGRAASPQAVGAPQDVVRPALGGALFGQSRSAAHGPNQGMEPTRNKPRAAHTQRWAATRQHCLERFAN
jgi:hypothetical protein